MFLEPLFKQLFDIEEKEDHGLTKISEEIKDINEDLKEILKDLDEIVEMQNEKRCNKCSNTQLKV